jgi:hypothetical protein
MWLWVKRVNTIKNCHGLRGEIIVFRELWQLEYYYEKTI